jgi:hypothetical protein
MRGSIAKKSFIEENDFESLLSDAKQFHLPLTILVIPFKNLDKKCHYICLTSTTQNHD